MLFGGVGGGDDVLGGEGDFGQRRGLHRNRLRRGGLLTGHVALRHRRFLDSEHGLAGLAIQDVHVAGLSGEREDRDSLPVDLHVEESRRGRQIEVPQVVMDRLIMPAPLAGTHIECHDGITEQVISRAVGPEVVRRPGALEGREYQLPLHVDGERESPVKDPGLVLPGVALPGLVPRLSRAGCGMEHPRFGAVAQVERAHAPGRCIGAD